MLTLADKISLIRICAVPLLIVTIFYYRPEADHLRFYALGIFLAAAFSDLIDGSIAGHR